MEEYGTLRKHQHKRSTNRTEKRGNGLFLKAKRGTKRYHINKMVWRLECRSIQKCLSKNYSDKISSWSEAK